MLLQEYVYILCIVLNSVILNQTVPLRREGKVIEFFYNFQLCLLWCIRKLFDLVCDKIMACLLRFFILLLLEFMSREQRR
jgi:hypothetical protein